MKTYDQNCQLCPRLSGFLQELQTKYPDYHNLPVAPFGAKSIQLLIVGLAPGMHGANATARPFTGDYAGILLYQTMHEYGWSNQANAVDLVAQQAGLVKADARLKLKKCRITNAVKCLPPQNKPIGAEIKTCNPYLKNEISEFKQGVVLALGRIAHEAVIRAIDEKQSSYKFIHNQAHAITPSLTLLDSYHCSRYNTNTGRLTVDMFRDVFEHINKLLDR